MTDHPPPLTVDLSGAAATLGVSYDYLQGRWRDMVEAGFPQPYIGNLKGARPRR